MERSASRLRVLALLVVLMFLGLSTRLWFLQVLATQRFSKEATKNSARIVYSDPIRGRIVDDTGQHVLVGNQSSLEVRITPDLMGDQGESVILQVSKLTGVPVKQIVKTLQDPKYVPSQSIPVVEFVSKKVQWFIKEYPERFPGVEVKTTYVRSMRTSCRNTRISATARTTSWEQRDWSRCTSSTSTARPGSRS
jgi:penicillin-binding protein 2